MERYERLRELGRGSYGCAVLVRERNSRQPRQGPKRAQQAWI